MLGPEESAAVLVAKGVKQENTSSVLLGHICLDLYWHLIVDSNWSCICHSL